MTRQYYYKDYTCAAPNSDHPDCICWHDEGTGPLVGNTSMLTWREKPSQPTHPTIVLSETHMPLRDYFAAKVLPSVYKEYVMGARIKGWDENWKLGVALDAYAMADAMLKARKTSVT